MAAFSKARAPFSQFLVHHTSTMYNSSVRCHAATLGLLYIQLIFLEMPMNFPLSKHWREIHATSQREMGSAENFSCQKKDALIRTPRDASECSPKTSFRNSSLSVKIFVVLPSNPLLVAVHRAVKLIHVSANIA